MLYYLNLCSDGDDDYGFGDGDGTTCTEPEAPFNVIQSPNDITPYKHKSAPYLLSAVDLLTKLAAREVVTHA